MLDSSVLVPYWSRIAFQRLVTQPQPPITLVWSEWIIAETWRVLTWRWLEGGREMTAGEWRQLARSANDMMRHLLPVMDLSSLHGYAGPEPWPTLRDRDDIPIWDTATAAGARYVVSHNTVDFPPLVDGRHIWQGVEYLTAIELIEDVLGEDITLLTIAPLTPAMLQRSHRTG